MPIVKTGDLFPDFVAQGIDTAALRKEKPLFTMIWKKSCPTCRKAMPFYQRLHEVYPDAAVVGISQDDSLTTTEYCKENGITFPQIADEDDDLTITRIFKPDTVPSYFLTDKSGKVLMSGEAWNADALNEIAQHIGEKLGQNRPVLVPESESVARFTPG